MKWFLWAAVIVLTGSLCFGQSFFGASEFYVAPQTGGTRAVAMGGAYSAVNAGIDALYGNPAGLVKLDQAQFLGGGRLRFTGSSKYEDSYYEDENFVTDYSRKFKLNPKILNLGVAFPVNISGFQNKVVGAVGYKSVYDYSNKISTEYKTDNGSFESTSTTKGLLNYLSFGLGAEFGEKVSLGFSFNLPVMKGLQENYESKSKGETDTYNYESEAEYEVSGGNFLQLGGIVQITPALGIGASYMTSHSFKVGKTKWKVNDNGEKSNGKSKQEDKIEFPGLYSIGLSYKVSPELLLTADIQNRPWESMEVNGDEIEDVENGSVYRLGFEYGTHLLLRGGFALERLPLVDDDLDPVNAKWITAGIGTELSNLLLDISAAYRFATYSVELDVFDPDSFDTITKSYDYKISELVFYATVRYAFDFKIDL